MTIEATPEVVASVPEESGYEAAVKFLEESRKADVVDDEAEDETEAVPAPKAKPKPAAKPAADEVAEQRKALADERRQASELLTKVKGQHEALDRRKAKVEADEASVATAVAGYREARTKGAIALVAYLERETGAKENSIWEDIADQLRNEGKRSPANESARGLAELRAELEAERKERADEKRRQKEEADAQAAAEAEKTIGSTVEQYREEATKLVDADPDLYPALANYPKRAVGTLTLDLMSTWCDRYKAQYGVFPQGTPPVAEFLAVIEKQEAEEQEAAAATRAKPRVAKAKVRIPSNDETATESEPRRLTFEEREALVERELAEGKIT
jgi:hypothetical protein